MELVLFYQVVVLDVIVENPPIFVPSVPVSHCLVV